MSPLGMMLLFVCSINSAVGPAPTVTSINYTVGDTAGGGQPILVDGTDFVDGCTCTLGTVTFISDTQISVALGSHASGSVDVVVTNPDAQTTRLGILLMLIMEENQQ